MNRRPLPFLIYLFTFACPCSGQVPPPPNGGAFGLPAYVSELEKWSAAADRLKNHPEEAATLKTVLPKSWLVVVAGQRFVVSTDWLRGKLNDCELDPGNSPDQSKEMLVRLRAMLASAQSMMAVEAPPQSEAHLKLNEILRRREFRRVSLPSATQTWWDRLSNWIAGKLNRFFTGPVRQTRFSRALMWVLAGGFAFLLAFGLLRSTLATSGLGVSAFPIAAPAAAGSREWAARARSVAELGDYREAVHLAYWAALYRIEETGFWKVDRTRTPREYLRLVPAGHNRRAPLEALTRRFERVWYAGEKASSSDFGFAAIALEELGCPLAWNPVIAAS